MWRPTKQMPYTYSLWSLNQSETKHSKCECSTVFLSDIHVFVTVCSHRPENHWMCEIKSSAILVLATQRQNQRQMGTKFGYKFENNQEKSLASSQSI